MEKQLDAAKEALRISVDRESFDINRAERDRVQALYDTYIEGLNNLRSTVATLTSEDQGIEYLKGEYERLNNERTEEANQIYNASNQTVELPEYDASTGYPEWVEPPELTTGDGSTDDSSAVDDSSV